MSNTRNILVPEELCLAAEKMFAGRFNSMDELVAHLLREVLREDASRMDEAELAIIEQRLRGLGYV